MPWDEQPLLQLPIILLSATPVSGVQVHQQDHEEETLPPVQGSVDRQHVEVDCRMEQQILGTHSEPFLCLTRDPQILGMKFGKVHPLCLLGAT